MAIGTVSPSEVVQTPEFREVSEALVFLTKEAVVIKDILIKIDS